MWRGWRIYGGYSDDHVGLGAVSGAAHSCELYTEEDRLGAVSGAADSCELFTEHDLLEAVSGAAGGCGPEKG